MLIANNIPKSYCSMLRRGMLAIFCSLMVVSVAIGSSTDGGGGQQGGGNSGGGGSESGGSGNSGGGGSESGGSGNSDSSSSSSGGGGGEFYSANIDRGPVSYDVGKKLFREVVVCGDCPFGDLALQSENVRQAWKQIKLSLRESGEVGMHLKWSERQSIKRYIKKRYIKAKN